MGFDSRFSLAKKTEVSHGYRSGILAKGIGEISGEADLARRMNATPWAPWARNIKEAGASPKEWCAADDFLAKRFGTLVSYDKNYARGTTKKIGRFSSNGIQSLLKRTKSELGEFDLLKGVNEIIDDCNLRGTSIETLTDLYRIGGNLTLDASSSIKNISGLKNIGKLTVVAKNQEEMEAFLKKIGLMAQNGEMLAKIKNGVHFVMKNYL